MNDEMDEMEDEAHPCASDGCEQAEDAHQACDGCGEPFHQGADITGMGSTSLYYDDPSESEGSFDGAEIGDAYCSIECLIADYAPLYGFVRKAKVAA